MIAKIKLITTDRNNYPTLHYIFKRPIQWVSYDVDPQVGMTVIIPQGEDSFRFYITHIVYDMRTNETIIVERRKFYHDYGKHIDRMEDVRRQLEKFEWETELIPDG